MKRMLCLALCLALALSLCACTGEDTSLKELMTWMEEARDTLEQLSKALEELEQALENLPEPTEADPGTDPTEAPVSGGENASPYDTWWPLVGYWQAADGQYFQLDMADSTTAFLEEGIWGTGYSRGGHIAALTQNSGVHSGTVHFSATEGSEMDDPRPARDADLRVDWRDLDQDGILRITLDGVTYQCTYGGATAQEAFDAYQQGLGGPDDPDIPEEPTVYDLEGLWARLEGVWECGDHFVCFAYQDGQPTYFSGTWGLTVPYGREPAVATGLVAFAGFYNVSVTYPPEEDRLIYTVTVGVTELEAEGTISVVAPEDDQRTYTRCADTYLEALEAHS